MQGLQRLSGLRIKPQGMSVIWSLLYGPGIRALRRNRRPEVAWSVRTGQRLLWRAGRCGARTETEILPEGCTDANVRRVQSLDRIGKALGQWLRCRRASANEKGVQGVLYVVVALSAVEGIYYGEDSGPAEVHENHYYNGGYGAKLCGYAC